MALQGLVRAQDVSNDTAREARADKAHDQPNTAGTPLILEAIKNQIDRATSAIVAQNDEAAAKRKDEREASDLKAQWEMSRWAENMFWVALGSLVVTFLGVLLIWRTLVYSKEAAVAANAMVVESANATAAAMAATSEAKRQADFAEAALQTADRPWVGPHKDPEVVLAVGQPLKVTVWFKNYGKTPAFKLRQVMRLSARPHGSPDPERLETVDQSTSSQTVFPDQEFFASPYGALPTITSADLADIENGRRKIWIFGRVEYFGQTGPKRFTAFRLYYMPGYGWVPTEDGNEAN